ncbi:hypothetical protein Kisp01_64390 [Kineosporia sp. NBRC 101677]|uniref:TIGR02680 family protein n=1 Tax=Kineosporia sp. NBRC 101677 TaxID=3032197 RepID=UPI0024A0D328|nr:TIGR02680 family protein [Kineosporia sp. NBRC 101677]GLY19425.1 hypothetical protein Kisp01_64390 [Kineosporia sp. NBRC 101677]
MSVQNLDQHRHRPEPAGAGRTPRWRPVRAGILNIWRYYDEVFEFHQGRLLVRGPNGSGKSKALELLLPFLFDASLRANRLSTFGTGDRAMHWNLMGEGAGGAVTRVGYAWLELALGEGEWFTCGVRLSATTRTSTVNSDWFTTDQRVGVDLHLLNPAGQPLTKAALEAALHSRGTVHPNAGEYRNALRGKLFEGMNEARYDALITALLQLRTPKLSQRLDPGLLSTLLSRALPPLDQGDIAELAEGFERLDRQREELRRLAEIVEAARTVARQAQTYSRRVLRAAAAGLISATTALENASQKARESAADYERVVADLQEADERGRVLAEQIAAQEARIEGLTSSEAYGEGRELDDLRTRDEQARARAERLARTAERDRAELRGLRERTRQRQEILDSATRELQQSLEALTRTAERVNLSARVPAPGATVDAAAARRLITVSVGTRRQEIAEIRAALAGHQRAVQRREQAETAKDEALTRRQEVRAVLERAEDDFRAALAEQSERLLRWANECRLLQLDPAVLSAAEADETQVRELVSQARDGVVAGIATERSGLVGLQRRAAAEHAQIQADLEKISSEVHLPPTAPLTRTASRQGRSGAPLWQLITFQSQVPASVQAGIEAALEASGLLDAWITPTGQTLSVEGHDVFARSSRPAVRGPSLADVLAPETDPAVAPAVINGVLAAVAYGNTLPASADAAIGADGSWRLAALQGSWSKPEAGFIGATARQRARRQRIAELTEQLEVLAAQLDEVGQALDELSERESLLAAEVRARPGFERVAEAQNGVWQAQAALTTAEDTVIRAQDRLAEEEVAAGQALRTLMSQASEQRLPAEEAALAELELALAELSTAAETWASAHLLAGTAADAVNLFAGQCANAERTAGHSRQEAETAQTEAEALTHRRKAVEQAIGSTYEQVLVEVQAARQLRKTALREQEHSSRTQRELVGEEGRLRNARERDLELHQDALGVRDQAADGVHALLGGHLVQDAGLELDLGEREGSRAALEAARAVAAAWPTIPYEHRHLTAAQSNLMETLHAQQDTLARRADLEMVTEHEVAVLSASIGGVRTSAATLLHRLRTELEGSQDDITGAEHQLFDRTLTGDTRRHLAARIRQAGELVDTMNERLAMVRTASSVAVRLTWQIDPQLPAGTRAARDLLLKDPVRLSEDDRQALHVFFRQRIEQARAANTAASWEEQLAEVFDYTAWHHFQVDVERGKGLGWEKLTSKLHGALSGGEKAIALHLPLFAAIAAHYQAVPLSPRIILLDEVFVGVDTVNRGQVFALLAALDLDLVLTSDHEWGTYRELDGIAVHQLETGSGLDQDDAVTSVRFTWDGAELRPDADD